jgi:hypothetical protein
MLTYLLPPADHRLVQAGMLGHFLLAIGEPLRGLADLPDGSQRGKYGGVAG